MASRMKDWRARADWETLILSLSLRRLPLIGAVARDEAARRARTACVLARKLDAFWMVRETPRKNFGCAPANAIALHFYRTNLGQCEGFVSGPASRHS